MNGKTILKEVKDRMFKSEQVFIHELAGVRTGKASPALVENVMVEAYGSQVRLKEVAAITTPEPRLLLIQPWDVNLIGAIEKAIQKANIGLTPIVDNKLVRIPFPELSAQRRQELVKAVRKMAEDARVAIRNIRRDAIERLKKMAKEGGISEDEQKHVEKELQKLTDEFIGKIDDHLKKKEQEIMSV